MILPEWPRCGVHNPETGEICDRPAETLGYCVPCWVQMDLEGTPIDAPHDDARMSEWETDAAAARGWGA